MLTTFRKERSLQPCIVLCVTRGRTAHTTARCVPQALRLSNCEESNEGGRPYAEGRGLSRSAEGATRLRAVALWHAFNRCFATSPRPHAIPSPLFACLADCDREMRGAVTLAWAVHQLTCRPLLLATAAVPRRKEWGHRCADMVRCDDACRACRSRSRN